MVVSWEPAVSSILLMPTLLNLSSLSSSSHDILFLFFYFLPDIFFSGLYVLLLVQIMLLSAISFLLFPFLCKHQIQFVDSVSFLVYRSILHLSWWLSFSSLLSLLHSTDFPWLYIFRFDQRSILNRHLLFVP